MREAMYWEPLEGGKVRCRLCPLNDVCPKLPLSKRDWRMLRKVITARGEVLLREQPVMRVKKKDRG